MKKMDPRRILLMACGMAGCTAVATVADASMLVSIGGAEFIHGDNVLMNGLLTFLAEPPNVNNVLVATLPHVWRTATTGNYSIYIDGKGPGISCSINIADYQGTVLSSVNRTGQNISGSWEVSALFAASSLPEWAYITLQCIVPGSAGTANVGLWGAALGN